MAGTESSWERREFGAYSHQSTQPEPADPWEEIADDPLLMAGIGVLLVGVWMLRRGQAETGSAMGAWRWIWHYGQMGGIWGEWKRGGVEAVTAAALGAESPTAAPPPATAANEPAVAEGPPPATEEAKPGPVRTQTTAPIKVAGSKASAPTVAARPKIETSATVAAAPEVDPAAPTTVSGVPVSAVAATVATSPGESSPTVRSRPESPGAAAATVASQPATTASGAVTQVASDASLASPGVTVTQAATAPSTGREPSPEPLVLVPVPAWVRASLDAALGDRYGEYSLLGAGGMGTVVRATDHKLERTVAVKLPPPQLAAHPEFRERFVREARAQARLSHPAVGGVHDVPDVPEGEIPVMVLEYLQGVDLGEWLSRNGPGPVEQMIEWTIEAGDGLAHADSRGVLHRDIKPSNMMLVEGRIRLLDFGLASLEGDAKLTATGMVMGSIPYMSPEQLRGDAVDERADQFSLAAAAFELLTGQVPFPLEDSARTALRRLEDLRPELPEATASVIRKGLHQDPASRHASVAEFVQALRAACG